MNCLTFRRFSALSIRPLRHVDAIPLPLAFEEANRLISLAHSSGILINNEGVLSVRKQTLDAASRALKVRNLLGVTQQKQQEWKDRDAWDYFRKKIESWGFIISIQELDEGVDGFVVVKEEGVAIVINQNVKSFYRRTFTLLHELGHYFQNVSAACNTYEVIHDFDAEAYADDFASNVLIPQSIFFQQAEVKEIASKVRAATESDYALLSKRFCVSMSQIAVRLFKIKLIARTTLDKQLEKAERIFRENEKKKKEKNKARKGFDPNGHERKAIGRMSVPIASSLLIDYRAEKITAKDFSSSMGVSINLVGRIENMLKNERS